MCIIYNPVGSLTTIKSHLRRHNINDFNSLNEVIAFQKTYSTHRLQIISSHKNFIEHEKNNLSIGISELDNSIKAEKIKFKDKLHREIELLEQKLNDLSTPVSFIQRMANFLTGWYYKKKIQQKKLSLDSKTTRLIKKMIKTHEGKTKRYQYIVSHFEDAVNESCSVPLKKLERKKRIIDELNAFIYGALGEQKVVKELKNLSDEYFLINDFSVSFSNPIYNRQGNDYIKSIQIDHILVAPSGVFLIETKNWNEQSLNNQSLYSPVQQVKRASFALFKILSGEKIPYKLKLNRHHWGSRKIPIRNLIVMIDSKPHEEFQYVKILTINELLGYVTYFKPSFSNQETQEIANYLLSLTNQKQLLPA